jgi:LacI family transcriptional regulator
VARKSAGPGAKAARARPTADAGSRPDVPQRAQLKDVARAVGVHPSTVSRALDPEKSHLVQQETRKRIYEVQKELGYTPNVLARGLRAGRTMSVGVVIADIANPFASLLLRGITDTLERREYTPLIAQTHDEPGRLAIVLRNLRDRRVDAVIVAAAHRGDDALLRGIVDAGIPLVLAVRAVDDRTIPTVTHDDFAGGVLAAGHFAELGHKVAVQLPGPSDISSFRQRAHGFDATAKERGLQLRELDTEAVAPTVEEGRRLMDRLLRSRGRRPTAVFAHNDWMAIGAIDVLRSRGLRCPDDVSVLGYNDAPLSDHLSPSLSSIRFPALEVGRMAADVALARITGPENQPLSVSFPPSLVPRESTGPPPEKKGA